MQKLYISPTINTPEINFSPDENIFLISGTSSPEDVREMYYPVIEWIQIFIDDLISGESRSFSADNPIKLRIDLEYFNSSSAKFLFDIFYELKQLKSIPIPYIIEWHYDSEDTDMLDAGTDIASLAETDFIFIPKNS